MMGQNTLSASLQMTPKLRGAAGKWEVIQRDGDRLKKQPDMFSEHKSTAATNRSKGYSS